MKLTEADKLWREILLARGVNITREWIIAEVEKCRNDFVYFINNYCLIKNKAEDSSSLPPDTIIYGDVIDLKLFDIQAKYLRSVRDCMNTVAIKTRQSGISLTTGLYTLHKATFESNKEIVILSKSEREAIKFLDDVKFAHQYLPFFLRRQAGGNMKKLVLGNKYKHTIIRALPGGKSGARSYTASLLVLDEAAFIANVDDIWAGAAPVLSTTGGHAVMISTPWEDDGLFYETVEGARDNLNDFNLIEIPWTSIPGRDEKWYQAQCARLNYVEEKIKTELDMQFISRGTPFFKQDKLKEKGKAKPLVSILNEKIEIEETTVDVLGYDDLISSVSFPVLGKGYVYELPKPGSKYVIGHDPAEDGTKSRHGIVVFNVDGFPKRMPNVALEYASRSMVMDSLVDLGHFYNEAKVVVEKNRGYAVILHFGTVDSDELLFKRPNGQYGLVTNTASRQILLKLLAKYFTHDVDKIPIMLYDEAKGFVRNKAGRLKGKKFDDLLFASGMALLGLATYPDLLVESFEGDSTDTRIQMLESLKNAAEDREIPNTTTNRYIEELYKRLFGNVRQQSTTNLSEDQLKKIKQLLPA